MRQRLVLVAALVVLLLGGAAAQPSITITALVLEGDNVPGVGNVVRIDNVAVNNSGEWLVEVDTDFANSDQDQVLLKNGVLFLREDDPLPMPEGARLDSFDSINLNSDGDSGWNFFLTGTQGLFDDSGVYFNTTLVIQESDTSTADGFSPGTPYIGFFDAKINDMNQIMLVASIDDPNIPSTVDRGLVRLDLDPGGNLLLETVVAKEGDVLSGQIESVTDFGTDPHESAFNDHGDVLFFADLTGSTAADGVIYLNDALIAQEGSPSPIPDRNYAILSDRGNDLNNNGGYVFKAKLDGDTSSDDVLIRNNTVFKQEGESFPAIGAHQLTGFGLGSGPVQIEDSGNVVWFGDWDDPNTDEDTGIFRNEDLIVQEGVTMIGAILLDTIANGTDAFMLSDSGQWLIFEGTLVGGIEGAFLVHIEESSSVGSQQATLPPSLMLSSHPNPFARQAVVRYNLAHPSGVRLEVLDVGGRLVKRLLAGSQGDGLHEVLWDGRGQDGNPVGAGIYFLRFQTEYQLEAFRIAKVR